MVYFHETACIIGTQCMQNDDDTKYMCDIPGLEVELLPNC